MTGQKNQNEDIPGHLKTALSCKCPVCKKGDIFKKGFLTLAVKEKCETCGFPLGRHDSADGPAVFLIFILGFLLVPLALFAEFTFAPPIWFHMVFWGAVALIMIFGMLRPIKAYVIGLQYRHRPEDWDMPDDNNEKT